MSLNTVKQANSKRIEAVLERRRSNAAGTMLDRRTKRKRTRKTQKEDAIREY